VVPVRLLPGFKKRAEAVLAKHKELQARAGEADRAVLGGAVSMVARVYGGEPVAGAGLGGNAVTELEALERMLPHVEGRRRALAGREPPFGDLRRIVIGLATSGDARWPCALAGRARSELALGAPLLEPRLLVVALPGTPIWATHLGAPSSPAATPPGF